MANYIVSARGKEPTEVSAANWLMALGTGLEQLGVKTDFDRLACEVLPNGTVIARDVRTGSGFVVQPIAEDATTEPIEPVSPHVTDPEAIELGSGETADDWPTSEVLREAIARHVADEASAPALQTALEDVEPEQTLPKGRKKGESRVASLLEGLATAPEPSVAWTRALRVAHELIQAESGAALAAETTRLRFVAASGPHGPKLQGMAMPRGAGFAGFCMERIVSIVIREPSRDRRFYAAVDNATGYHTRSLMCVPVHLGGQAYGCLELLNAPPNRPFTRADIEQLERIASVLAHRLGQG